MLRLLGVAALLLGGWTVCNERTGPTTVVARNYPSGFLSEAKRDVDLTIRARLSPVITGTIYSAGTIITRNPLTCASEHACLAFHAPLHPVTWQPWIGSARENAAYLAQHPPGLQEWIRSSGSQTDMSGRYHFLCTPDLWRYVRPC